MNDPEKWEKRRRMQQRGCMDCRYFIRSLRLCTLGEENCILLSEDLADERPPCRYCYWWDGRKGVCSLGPGNCGWLIGKMAKEKVARIRAAEAKRRGHTKQDPVSDPSLCDGCPYKNSRPCVGVCMKNVLQEWKKIRTAVEKAGDAMV